MNIIKQQLETLKTNHKIEGARYTTIDCIRNSTGELEGCGLAPSDMLLQQGSNFIIIDENNLTDREGNILIGGYEKHYEKNGALYVTDRKGDTYKVINNTKIFQNRKLYNQLDFNAVYFANAKACVMIPTEPQYLLSNIISGNATLMADGDHALFLSGKNPVCLDKRTGEVWSYSFNNEKIKRLFAMEKPDFIGTLGNGSMFVAGDSGELCFIKINNYEAGEEKRLHNVVLYCFSASDTTGSPKTFYIRYDEISPVQRCFLLDAAIRDNKLKIVFKNTVYAENHGRMRNYIQYNTIDLETGAQTKNIIYEEDIYPQRIGLSELFFLFSYEAYARITDQNNIALLVDKTYINQVWGAGGLNDAFNAPTGLPVVCAHDAFLIDPEKDFQNNVIAVKQNVFVQGWHSQYTAVSLSENVFTVEKTMCRALIPQKITSAPKPYFMAKTIDSVNAAAQLLLLNNVKQHGNSIAGMMPQTFFLTLVKNYPVSKTNSLVQNLENTDSYISYNMEFQLGQEVILCADEKKLPHGLSYMQGRQLYTAYAPDLIYRNPYNGTRVPLAYNEPKFKVPAFVSQRNLLVSIYNKDKVLTGKSHSQNLDYNKNMILLLDSLQFDFGAARYNDHGKILSAYLEITPAPAEPLFLAAETDRGTGIIYENQKNSVVFLDAFLQNTGEFFGLAQDILDITPVSGGLFIATQTALFLQKIIGTTKKEYFTDPVNIAYDINMIGDKFTLYDAGNELVYIWNNKLTRMPYPVFSKPRKALPNKNRILLQTHDNLIWIISPPSRELALISKSESTILTLDYLIKDPEEQNYSLVKENPKFRFSYYLGNTPKILKNIKTFSKMLRVSFDGRNLPVIQKYDLYQAPGTLLFKRESRVEIEFENFIADEITLELLKT